MDRPIGMNWGSGPTHVEGWVNVDNAPQYAPFVDAEHTRGFPDESFDGIVANHSLQCLAYVQLDVVLAELRRLLRPGGRLRVLVPDVWAAFRAYDDGDIDWPGFAAISEDWSFDRKFAHYLTWGGQNRSCFTSESLDEILHDAGFHGKVPEGDPWPWLCELDTRRGESIIMEVAR